MRHLTKIKTSAGNGEQRLRVGFLFFPRTINGERRWLEYASWMQTFTYHWRLGSSWNDSYWCLYPQIKEETTNHPIKTTCYPL